MEACCVFRPNLRREANEFGNPFAVQLAALESELLPVEARHVVPLRPAIRGRYHPYHRNANGAGSGPFPALPPAYFCMIVGSGLDRRQDPLTPTLSPRGCHHDPRFSFSPPGEGVFTTVGSAFAGDFSGIRNPPNRMRITRKSRKGNAGRLQRRSSSSLVVRRRAVPVTQPEAYQMPPLFRLRMVFERGAVVQQPVIACEKHLSRLQQHLNVQVLAG